MTTPEEELEEIDWVTGLVDDMPRHLVNLGTTYRRYTHEVRLLRLPPCGLVTEDSTPYMSLEGVDYEIVPLPEVREETYVWGVKV